MRLQWKRQEIQVRDVEIQIIEPDRDLQAADVIYLHATQPEEGLAIAEALSRNQKSQEVILVSIYTNDWNGNLTPWPAKKAFAKGEDFTGQAEEYLQLLTTELIPQIEELISKQGIVMRRRMLAGYSLAGLFTLYAVTKTNLFQAVASVSGSLWYDDFAEYFIRQVSEWKLNKELVCKHIYLSLGDKEARTNNERMAKVQDKTEEIYHVLCLAGIDTFYELNPGNHFANVEDRMAKAITWMFGDS